MMHSFAFNGPVIIDGVGAGANPGVGRGFDTETRLMGHFPLH